MAQYIQQNPLYASRYPGSQLRLGADYSTVGAQLQMERPQSIYQMPFSMGGLGLTGDTAPKWGTEEKLGAVGAGVTGALGLAQGLMTPEFEYSEYAPPSISYQGYVPGEYRGGEEYIAAAREAGAGKGGKIGGGVGTGIGVGLTAITGGAAAPLIPVLQKAGEAIGGIFGGEKGRMTAAEIEAERRKKHEEVTAMGRRIQSEQQRETAVSSARQAMQRMQRQRFLQRRGLPSMNVYNLEQQQFFS